MKDKKQFKKLKIQKICPKKTGSNKKRVLKKQKQKLETTLNSKGLKRSQRFLYNHTTCTRRRKTRIQYTTHNMCRIVGTLVLLRPRDFEVLEPIKGPAM